MNIYKSSSFVMIKNVVYGIFGGLAVLLIAYQFFDETIAIVLGALVGLLILYITLFSDNIKVVVAEEYMFVYRFNKLKHQFKRSECQFNARIKTSSGDSDCYLTIIGLDGETTNLNCSMLGKSRFEKLLVGLSFNDSQPQTLNTTKKGDK